MTSVSRRYGVHAPFYDSLQREAERMRALAAVENRGPVFEFTSEQDVLDRLTAAENDLTDLSRLFVRLEALVLRGDRSGYRPEPPSISDDSVIICACGARHSGATYSSASFCGFSFIGVGFIEDGRHVPDHWGAASCPSCTKPAAGVPSSDSSNPSPSEDVPPDRQSFDTDATAKAFDVLRKALQDDPDYAWGWHCNIAMAFYDVGGDHAMANKAAHLFMQRTFGVTTVEPGGKKL